MSTQAATGCLAVLFFLQLQLFPFSGAVLTTDPDEARDIAEEAYIFFHPVVDNWRFLYFTTRDATPAVAFNNSFQHGDSFVAPNENVIYSVGWLDLRQEPRVVTVRAPVVQGRYYSLQIVDGYTHNLGIVSERTFPTPTQDGNFIVAGPGQCQETGACTCDEVNEVDGIFHSESVFALALLRIQAFSDDDLLNNVSVIQEGFKIQRLSDFCEEPGPVPEDLPEIFRVPILASIFSSFFFYVNRIMEFITIDSSETGLFANFAKIGVVPGETFPPPGMSRAVLLGIGRGVRAGRAAIERETNRPSMADVGGGWQLVLNPPQWGTREVMQGRYLTRATGSRGGRIYGLDPQEVLYPIALRSNIEAPLNGGTTQYYMLFTDLTLPPVFENRGFWSITMHNRLNSTTFVPNPLNRFSIGSRELSTLCRYENGLIPIIIQAEEPTEEGFRRNWLPAPNSLFFLVNRLYAPRPRAFVGPYLPPPIRIGPIPQGLGVPTNCPP